MSEETNHSHNGPAFIAYHAVKTKNNVSVFNKIGAAWPTKDGKGFSIQLECMPLDGRVILLTPKEKQ